MLITCLTNLREFATVNFVVCYWTHIILQDSCAPGPPVLWRSLRRSLHSLHSVTVSVFTILCISHCVTVSQCHYTILSVTVSVSVFTFLTIRTVYAVSVFTILCCDTQSHRVSVRDSMNPEFIMIQACREKKKHIIRTRWNHSDDASFALSCACRQQGHHHHFLQDQAGAGSNLLALELIGSW